MMTIPLTRGQFAVVDDQDFARLSAHKWRAQWSKSTGQFYAVRWSARINGNRSFILMHREVLMADPAFEVDHKNGNTLDNTRSNLRLATSQQNKFNQRARRDSKSGIKGVKRASVGSWQARIAVDGKMQNLGCFPSQELALSAYEEAARKLHGEFYRSRAA